MLFETGNYIFDAATNQNTNAMIVSSDLKKGAVFTRMSNGHEMRLTVLMEVYPLSVQTQLCSFYPATSDKQILCDSLNKLGYKKVEA